MKQLKFQYCIDRADGRGQSRRSAPWVAGGTLISLIGIAVAIVIFQEEPVSDVVPAAGVDKLHSTPGIAIIAPARVPDSGRERHDRKEMTVVEGDSLERLFRRHGLSIGDLASMTRLPQAAPHLRLLNLGDVVVVTHDAGRVHSLERKIDNSTTLRIERDGNGFDANVVQQPVQLRAVTALGVIRDSLFVAALDAGLADSVTMQMAEIFRWDIDFAMDVRVGDEFRVVYEQLWSKDKRIGDGGILAAEFVNRGRSYRAARYAPSGDPPGYFTPDGRSVRKDFLRSPVKFTRVSSVFDPKRRHPVLNTIRAHRGVDYAAPTGTLVRASGDGTVRFAGANGGYGNIVILEHGGAVSTHYAHLSQIANIGVGDRVTQGETIGHVGMSGLATGPHLHYEYRVNGVHRDPQRVTFAEAGPIPHEQIESFEEVAAPLWKLLDMLDTSELSARVSSTLQSAN